MSKYTYHCDECEEEAEREQMSKEFEHSCICGGELHLVLEDNYRKFKDPCSRCLNKLTKKCFNCVRSPDNIIKEHCE